MTRLKTVPVDPQARLTAALARVATDEQYPVSIPRVEGQRLQAWVERERARATIEIGLGYGISALYACAGLAAVGGGRHLAMDPNQSTRFENLGLELLREAGVEAMVEFYPAPSEQLLPRLLADGRRFDLGFVDGNHRFDWAFVDLVFLGRLVRPGGVIFLDDYQLPAISKAAAFFTANLGWQIEESATEDPLHAWAVLRTSVDFPARHFTHFVDF